MIPYVYRRKYATSSSFVLPRLGYPSRQQQRNNRRGTRAENFSGGGTAGATRRATGPEAPRRPRPRVKTSPPSGGHPTSARRSVGGVSICQIAHP